MVFDYQLEDIDTQTGGEPIFNGQDSVIWKNIRAAFANELKTMYQNLRSSGALSYEKIEQMFEEHQGKWCEAIFNEDARFKYIEPFVNDNANYLYMLLGSKEEQRKWWLYNRFRYIDSKYIAGDAQTDTIFLRPYAADDITLTPYADIYATIAWDATITQERAERNEPVTLECPYQSMNGNIVTIYSASQLASIGDISPLKVGQVDISNATRLQSLKVGDSSSSYSNSNLYSMTFGSNVLLQTVDARNCIGLGNTDIQGHTQTTVDLSGCSILEHVYFDGTMIQGVSLPNGGVLKTLSLPATIKNLTVLNQPAITSFSMEGTDYSQIKTLRIENCGSAIPVMDILEDMEGQSRIRIIGFTTSVSSTQDVEDFYDYLDTMRGMDENGDVTSTKDAVSGTITGLTSITGAWLADMYERYPNIIITYTQLTSYLYYYNNGSLWHTETIYNGGDGVYSGTPTKTADAQYTYTFAGWSKEDDNTVDADARSAVTADRNVYACYTQTLRTYTVYFYNGTTLLQTVQNVAYGSSATYTGSTPVNSEDASLAFLGWSPQPTNITGNTSCYAQFETPVVVAEITDSWDTIIANIDNGTYGTKYKVGNYKPLDLGTEGTINMQIVAIDADELSSGGYAPLTFIGMELLNTKCGMNSGNSTYGFWNGSNMKTYLSSTIFPLIKTANSNVATRMRKVTKYSSSYNYSTSKVTKNGHITTDRLWIPSNHEIVNDTSYETEGAVYSSIYKDPTSRIKSINNSATSWWTRSVMSSSEFRYIRDNGTNSGNFASSKYGVCLGFCLGTEAETIEDSWSDIFANEANGTYSTKYSIGDTKEIDLGTEGKHLMEIVAFDTDDLASGTGKAKITWISKTLLNRGHRMNPANDNDAVGTGGNGGWENCEMRTYLKNTIKPLIPVEIRNAIVEVTKIQSTVTEGTRIKNGQTTTDDVWIPSAHEIGSSNNYESTGAVYTTKFINPSDRKKTMTNNYSIEWWTRSAYSNTSFRNISTGGYDGRYAANDAYGVALGFCT